jgi:hypothetical protein
MGSTLIQYLVLDIFYTTTIYQSDVCPEKESHFNKNVFTSIVKRIVKLRN